MIILALDQSVRRSGWAVVETDRKRQARFRGFGWFGAQAADNDSQVEAFIDQVDQLVLDHQAGVLVWEKPSKFMARPGGVQARTLVLTRFDQALRDLAKLRRLSIDTVAANSWRAKVLGKGAGRLSAEEAKRRALGYCQLLGLAVSDHNQAEAICIGFWAATCSRAVQRLAEAELEPPRGHGVPA